MRRPDVVLMVGVMVPCTAVLGSLPLWGVLLEAVL